MRVTKTVDKLTIWEDLSGYTTQTLRTRAPKSLAGPVQRGKCTRPHPGEPHAHGQHQVGLDKQNRNSQTGSIGQADAVRMPLIRLITQINTRTPSTTKLPYTKIHFTREMIGASAATGSVSCG